LRIAFFSVFGVLGLLLTGAVGIAVFSISHDGFNGEFAKATCSSGAGCAVYRAEAACVSTIDKTPYTKEMFVWSRSVSEAAQAMAAHRPECTLGEAAWYSDVSPMGGGRKKLGQRVINTVKD
jgi:hypothetical protein